MVVWASARGEVRVAIAMGVCVKGPELSGILGTQRSDRCSCLPGLPAVTDSMAISHASTDGRKSPRSPQQGFSCSALNPAATIPRLAVLRRFEDGRVEVLAEAVSGQNSAHAPYGGVVPEIAARAHAEKIDTLARQVLNEAGLAASDLDGVAATAGPGLIGGVMAALMTAKGIALGAGCP
jgi:N6-L-threonylcarbamoyladenine synthase